MAMTIAEIECSYRQAKKKSEQIKILADLNACSQEKIMLALISTGKYKKRGKFLYPVETKPPTPKKPKESAENVTETKAVTIDIKTAIEVIANEVKSKREAISNANKEIRELQIMIAEIFSDETEIQKE